MKKEIYDLAKEALIDEIRFIDAEDLTEREIGNTEKFKGRQPRNIMPNAKTVIIASIYIGNFVTSFDSEHGRMSRLVLSGYYANIVKPIKRIQDLLTSKGYSAKILDGESDEVDIPIKGAAVKAGLGWIGKNSMLINPRYGSFQALGAIITDANIAEEYPIIENKCGECHRCIDSCPVKAIEQPKVLSKSKCLSYIMDDCKNGEIPNGISTNNYFFECDICQNACSWNQKHLKTPLDTPFGNKFDRKGVEKLLENDNLLELKEEDYKKMLLPFMKGYQLPYETFRRNIEQLRK